MISFSKVTPINFTPETIEIWFDLLGDLPFEVAKMAVKRLLLELPYPPTPAEIRKRAVEIALPAIPTGSEAWAVALKLINNYSPYRQKDWFDGIEPNIAKAVRAMGLQEMALTENVDVTRGQFLKVYEQIAVGARQDALLPDKLRNDIQELRDRKNGQLVENVISQLSERMCCK
jgi:hypothetical protein